MNLSNISLESIRKHFSGGYGLVDKKRSTVWSLPWKLRYEEGIYVGENGEVWMYWEFPCWPLEWEDAQRREELGAKLQSFLLDLENVSRSKIAKTLASRKFAKSTYREVHFLTLTWDDLANPPANTPPLAAEFHDAMTDGFVFPNRTMVIGVRLRSDAAKQAEKFMDQVFDFFTQALDEDFFDVDTYERDINLVQGRMRAYGLRPPSAKIRRQLEGWFNHGRTPDVTITAKKDHLIIDDTDVIEAAAVMSFDTPALKAPDHQWIADALAYPDGPRVVSVRATLEPATISRKRSRQAQRRLINTLEQQAASDDTVGPGVEYSVVRQLAKDAEDFFAMANEPLLTDCSIIMARRVSAGNDTYMDFLANAYGIRMKPLDWRQLPALDETLPTSSKRLNPFLQDLSVGMLAYAGMHAFDAIGDSEGALLGFSQQDMVPVYFDVRGASKANLPPATLIAADPGSGKTMLSQVMAYQAAAAGERVIFINPKQADDLSGLVELLQEAGIPAQIVNLADLERQKLDGPLDPFRYSKPHIAGDIASEYLLSILGDTLDGQDRIDLRSGIKDGVVSGARCVGEAMRYIKNRNVQRTLERLIRGSSKVALAVAYNGDQVAREGGGEGLTLIEFGRKLDLPAANVAPSDYSDDNRIDLTLMRHVFRISFEILAAEDSNGDPVGGALFVDEAWAIMSSPSGRQILQGAGREGRSQGIAVVLASQRIADVVEHDYEGYLSRVFVMQLKTKREAQAALTLCGLEPTEDRVDFLRTAGPQISEEGTLIRPPIAIHRDLKDRHSAMYLGPYPEMFRLAFSTNPEDRAHRRRMKAAANETYEPWRQEDDSSPGHTEYE